MGKQSLVLRRLIDRFDGQGKQGKASGRSGIHGGAVEQRKGKGGGRKGKHRQVGSRCQRLKGKRKRRAVQWAAAGGLGGPTGLAGPKGERLSFSFFLFFFKLLLKQLFFSNSNQTLSNFFSKIL
jgi:hypothetical protein